MFPALQIREGRVKSISAKAAGELRQDGWVFLDVRPPPEIEKVRCSLMPQDDPALLHLSHPCTTLKHPCNAFELTLPSFRSLHAPLMAFPAACIPLSWNGTLFQA